MNIIDSVLAKFKTGYDRFFMPYFRDIKKEEWTVETWDAYKIYLEDVQIQSIMDKKASMFSNADVYIVDKNGEKKEDLEFQKLIYNPNFMQGLNDYLKTVIKHHDIIGNSFVYAPRASRLQRYPTKLLPLNPKNVKVNFTGKFLDQNDFKGVVQNFKYTEENKETTIETTDIIWTLNNDLLDFTKGESKLKSLKYPISNTILAYKYLNVLNNKQGALGMLSPDTGSNNQFGISSLTNDEKTAIEKAFESDYGTGDGKRKTMISPSSLKWQAMSYDVGSLQLQEQIDSNFLIKCDVFGVNSNCFSLKNPTYENVMNAIKLTYQDTIIPFADQHAQVLTKFFGLQNGDSVRFDYSHIPFLQESETQEIQDEGLRLANIEKMIALGLMSQSEAKKIIKGAV